MKQFIKNLVAIAAVAVELIVLFILIVIWG